MLLKVTCGPFSARIGDALAEEDKANAKVTAATTTVAKIDLMSRSKLWPLSQGLADV